MILLFILVWGMAIGWVASLIVRGFDTPVSWGEALVAGLAGSFVGGMLGSLINGDGIEFRASGIIGSIVGAILLLAAFGWIKGRRTAR